MKLNKNDITIKNKTTKYINNNKSIDNIIVIDTI